MAKTKKKEPRDLNTVWPAPLRCRGYRMGKEEILGRLAQKAAIAERSENKAEGKLVASLTPTVEAAESDVAAQQVLYRAGIPYLSGCGVDLRDQQYDLLQEHGRGVKVAYACGACGAPHTVKFGADPTAAAGE
jgi:hypothetical protein